VKVKNIIFLLLLILVSAFQAGAQERELIASPLSENVRIDGMLTEKCWENAKWYSDFVQYEPFNAGKPYLQTKVAFIYDQDALYVGAFMYDHAPDSILREMSRRDEVNNCNADMVELYLIPFNDGQNAFVFILSAGNIQEDIKISVDKQDVSWDAVWQSEVSINDSGWVAEIKIPYAAIRFSGSESQSWDLNFSRQIRRFREWSTLNFVDLHKDGFLTQSARLTGINGIKPPFRLSFFPYLSAYLQKNPGMEKFTYAFNYGADLKYGISQSFTLDVTLIPDFGQVQSDDQVLNLTPFEIQFDEKRQFFTEGTELFERAGIFYSRRIGGMPTGYYNVYNQLEEGEKIVNNPDKGRLINATKLSGRTNKGTGLGLFNAMVSPSVAIIENSTGNRRTITTQDFSNYSILVADQNLENNSFVSLINSNLYRKNYMANVTGSHYALRNRRESYMLYGRLIYSHIDDQSSHSLQEGIRNKIGFSKISGNFRFTLEQDIASKNFDINDMGFIERSDFITHFFQLAYNVYKPFWRLHFLTNQLWMNHTALFDFSYESFAMGWSMNTRFKNHLSTGLSLSAYPVSHYDYFESRVPGMKFLIPPEIKINFWLSPDYRKRFLVDVQAGYNFVSEFNTQMFAINLSPRIRISDKFLLVFGSEVSWRLNAFGFVNILYDSASFDVVFGKRRNHVVLPYIGTSFIFNSKTNLNLRFRHYYSTAVYSEFYVLDQEGKLAPATYSENPDINFNALDLDLVFTWYFAPGSEINIVWKYAIYDQGNIIYPSYFDNMDYLISIPSINSLSMRILYYFNWKALKRK